MTDTPRTDEAEISQRRDYESQLESGWHSLPNVVDSDFARTLERELTEWKKCAEELAQLSAELSGDGMTVNTEPSALAHFRKLKGESK